MILLFWSDASLWEKVFTVVVIGGLGFVAVAIVTLVVLVALVAVHFWTVRLIFTIRPQYCRRCGARFDSEGAYYALRDDLICVVCRSVSGRV